MPKSENVTQCTHESVYAKHPSINKNSLGVFESHIKVNYGWYLKVFNVEMIYMNNSNGNDPITWIFIYVRHQLYKKSLLHHCI